MPERTEYAAGEPSWADLVTTDVDAATTFYRTIFGWEADPVPMADAGGYTMLTLNGKYIGALSPKQQQDPGPTRWTVYANVDDADKTSELVQNAGGTVLMPVMDVFTAGRMALFADPTGAVIAVWQPQDHHGAQVMDEPGALTWFELVTSDTKKAQTFYTDVFGWVAQTSDGGGMAYTEFKIGDKSIAGMMAKPSEMPASAPSAWTPYFRVTDPDKLVDEISALGGTILMPGTDIPTGGRFAVVTDPQGAVFGLYRP